jgi:hypothetical protein
MDPTPELDLEARSRPIGVPDRGARLRGFVDAAVQRLRPGAERAVLWLHRRVERMDLVPGEFGRDAEVDQTDAGSLAREWLRQAKLWAGYNPEEMLALKAGALALGVALLLLIVLVGAIR